MKRAPYVNEDATNWCVEKRISLVGFDFYHGATGPGEDEHPKRIRRLRARRHYHDALYPQPQSDQQTPRYLDGVPDKI